MPYDYSDASSPSFELIPAGSIVTVSMKIRSGGVGEDGMLKRSKTGDAEMLDAEFTVTEGEFKTRKFWGNFVLDGTTDGHKKAAEISRGVLRTIIECAKNIKQSDMSPEARAARTVSLKDFDGLLIIVKVGIEKGGTKPDGTSYPDKNVLAGVITPDKKEWHPLEQAPPFDSGGATATNAAAVPIERPAWAS